MRAREGALLFPGVGGVIEKPNKLNNQNNNKKTTNMKKLNHYLAPEVTICEVAIEVGFAGSTTESTQPFGLSDHGSIDME